MNEIEQIIRINAYIQRGLGTITLMGKEVYCVAMDRTVTFKSNELIDEKEASDDELAAMFGQTFTVGTQKTPRQKAIEHLDEILRRTMSVEDDEERYKRIKLISKTLVDYSNLSESDIGRIHEAFDETVN